MGVRVGDVGRLNSHLWEITKLIDVKVEVAQVRIRSHFQVKVIPWYRVVWEEHKIVNRVEQWCGFK
jgi:hypothetical protein